MQIKIVFGVLIYLSLTTAHAASSCRNSITVQLPPARSVASSAREIACIAERAKYKCTPVGPILRGIGTYYGKGDNFSGGKTLCEKPFRPMKDKILALQDSLIPVRTFRNNLCGRKAVIVAYEPDSGRCTSTVAELSDTGNMGAKDVDGKSSTRDILKIDRARVGENAFASGKRIFDLSFAAAHALGYADLKRDDDGVDDGKAYLEVQICGEMAPGAVTPKSK